MKVPEYLESTLKKRYLQPGESPSGMLRRVANYVARAEGMYECVEPEALFQEKYPQMDTFQDWLSNEWFTTMDEGYWLPSSPFLMNAGTKVNMLSACFVCGLEDSMTGIFQTLEKAAMIWKTGGGTGFDFSALREEGAPIHSTGGTSTGPLAFMEIYNSASNGVKQGGKRRAASMGVLRIDHPDIIKFIRYKSDLTKLTNFNISVAITDQFMEAVKNKQKFNLIDPVTKVAVGEIDAYETFRELAYRNWLSAEPGILFIDTVNAANTVPHLGPINATNPCGEIPLLPWEACNLASINVEKFVVNGELNWDELGRIVRLVVRFLDDAIDVNELPLIEIETAVRKTRKLGLGIMGLHGALIRLGLAYDSAEGRTAASDIMSFVNNEAHKYSSMLAKERGCFAAWQGSLFHKGSEGPMRNATLTTIAPTGTISMINGASSSGLEPIFTHAYRRDIEGTSHNIVVPVLEEIAKKNGFWSEVMLEKVIANGGKATGIPDIPEYWQRILKTAMEISPEDHVLMQATLQAYVDNSISKTINLPGSATVDDIMNLYILAHSTNCKGCTVYRDGSRDSQVLYTGSKDDKKKESEKKRTELKRGEIIDAPESAPSVRLKVRTGCGKLYLIISYDVNGDIIETFIETGSDGGCEVFTRSTSRLISLCLRGGISLENVVDQLNSAGKCASYLYQKGRGKDVSPGKSCPSAIGLMLLDIQKKIKALRKLGIDPSTINDIIAGVDMKQVEVCKIETKEHKEEELRDELLNAKSLCPECGQKLSNEGGCVVCRNCGFSKCG